MFRRRLAHAILVLTAASLLLAPPSGAATVTIPDSGEAKGTLARDNTLYEPIPQSNFADLSNGAGANFFSGRSKDGYRRRGVIWFNVAQKIPAGSTITGVQLELNASRVATNTGQATSLHRLTAAWGEGTSDSEANEGQGAPPTTDDATWRHRFYPGTFWAANGAVGNYIATASATQSVGGRGFYLWSSTAALVADVQSWINTPAANFGWIVIGNEAASETSKRFDSSENTGSSAGKLVRPKLIVTYTPPAATGGCCLGTSCSVLTQAVCTSQGGVYQGDGSPCTAGTCSGFTGACCAVDGACSILDETACVGQGGTFQGAGEVCSPNPCPQPSGACCLGAGACSVLTQLECGAQSGTFEGDATTCSPNPCPQPSGACCFNDGTCAELSATDCSGAAGNYGGDGSTCAAAQCPVVLTPFVDPLPIPAVAQPASGTPGGTASYEIAMTEVSQKLHRDLPLTRVWGYAGGTPGPTILATVGQPVTVTWINDLRDANGDPRTDHYLPVDTCMKGPDTEGSTPRTVVHLHGGHVPTAVDGYPENTFLPGQQVTYVYPNANQLPGTLWYHDHAMGITRLNVYMGLAGFYLLGDAYESSLGLPSGPFEIGLAVQDRSFNPDGTLKYPEMWMDHFFGDTIMVNGKVWPYLNVTRGKYRFRLLSGSNSRTYTFSLQPGNLPFYVIGTEGGLLSAPVQVTSRTLGPGERADVVIDFQSLPVGAEVILTNSAPAPFPGNPGEGVIPNVMKFVVTGGAAHTAPLPATLRPVPPIPEGQAALTRTFELRKSSEPCAGSIWTINGLGWDDITEYPELGDVEIWRYVNRSGFSHPMHMHLAMFQILDRQPFTIVNDEVVPTGTPVPPAPEEAGWKDTAMVAPGEIVRVIAPFDDYLGRYAFHCHILEHEDHEMMRQFQTVQCGNATVEPTEQCDDGNLANGDLCSSDCNWEEFVEFEGQGQGGTVRITVMGVLVIVTTSPGATPEQVAAAVAAAINADPTLAGMGVVATTSGSTLHIGGQVDDIVFTDPGLGEKLGLYCSNDSVFWSSVGGRIGYDVVRGSLQALRTSGGDFSAAIVACEANNQLPTSLVYAPDPPAGGGWFHLVRVVTASGPGTYDSGGPNQQGARDAEIAASPNACP